MPNNYGKYKAKPIWWCLNCNDEVEPNPELSPAGYRKPSKCKRCSDIAQFFPSQLEYRRYRELRLLEAYGDIKDLELQPRYPIIWPDSKIKICTYVGDFRYKDGKTGKTILEDTKGVKTQLYVLKKRLMKAAYGITILEIGNTGFRPT